MIKFIRQTNVLVSLENSNNSTTQQLTIYKSFIRPLHDYADVIYDQPSNASFAKNIESVQYNAALAITRGCQRLFSQKIVPGVRTGISLSKMMDEKIVLTL